MAAADAELVQLLAALGSVDKTTRTQAEEMLARGETQVGFVPRLVEFAARGSPSAEAFPLRQMALTIVKRLSSAKWGQVCFQDKPGVKQALLMAIVESNRNLRGLLHVCVANVRCHEDWPELHESLSASLTRGTAHEAECCVECVATLLDECGPEVAKMLGPLQEPMHGIAVRGESAPGLRRQCVNAYVAGVQALLRDYDISERANADKMLGTSAGQIIAATLPSWMKIASSLLEGVDSWDDRDRVACAFTAVRMATTLSRERAFEDVMSSFLETVLRPACLFAQRLEPGFVRTVVNADDGGASEEECSTAPFIAQLMELLQAMLERPKLRILLKGHAQNLLSLFLPFMCITESQVNTWQADPNEFLAQEEDEHVQGCQIRYSGEGFIDSMMQHLKREAQRALAAVCKDLFEKGQGGAGNGACNWKLTEVAFFAFAQAAIEIPTKSLQRGELAPLVPVALTLARDLCMDRSTPELLRARAFGTLRKLGDAVVALSKQDVPALLEKAADGIAANQPLTVRVSACRAFCRFLTACSDKAFKDTVLSSRGVLQSLGSLLKDADEELLHLTLECLCLVIKECPGAMVSVAGSLGPLLLDIWRRCRGDYMVQLQVLDVISCAGGSHPSLQQALEAQLLPVVKGDLQPEAEQHATSAAIQLFDVLLKKAAMPIGPQFWCCVEPLLGAVMRSTESMLLQNSVDVLCALSKRAPKQIADSGLLVPLLQCTERFMGPELDDDACFGIGTFVTLLLEQFASLLSPELKTGLLRALIVRLSRAERPYLRQELIVVIARLMHEDITGVISILNGLQVVHKGKHTEQQCSGLQLLLTVWVAAAKAREILARRARHVTVPALCKLHAKCMQDVQLANIQTCDAAHDAPLAYRILDVLVGALEFENDRCQKLRNQPIDDDEDDDDEGDDDDLGDFDEDKGGRKIGKSLFDLVDLEDDSDFDEDFSDSGVVHSEMEKQDPFLGLDLRKHVAEYLVAAASSAASAPDLSRRLSLAVEDVRLNPV